MREKTIEELKKEVSMMADAAKQAQTQRDESYRVIKMLVAAEIISDEQVAAARALICKG